MSLRLALAWFLVEERARWNEPTADEMTVNYLGPMYPAGRGAAQFGPRIGGEAAARVRFLSHVTWMERRRGRAAEVAMQPCKSTILYARCVTVATVAHALSFNFAAALQLGVMTSNAVRESD